MSRGIKTSVQIEATRADVWRVLTDFGTYSHWNPFIRSIEGKPERGEQLVVAIEAPGMKRMTFRPTLIVVEEERELRWLGRFVMPGLFDGEHTFRLSDDPVPGTVTLSHDEAFRGLLVPVLWGRMAGPTQAGFEAMNLAIAKRCESGDG